MTARYRGTCIGGVADGHYIERDDVEIRIDARRKARTIINVDGSETPQEETLETSHYKFLLLLGTANAEIGCWALQGMSIEQVVTRLVRCYNPRTGLIGTPAANTLPIRKG